MKTKMRLVSILSLIIGIFFVTLTGLAVGQGPILTILPTPTSLPVVFEVPDVPNPLAQTALPDLVVEKIEFNPTTPLVNRSAIISVTIKNKSDKFLTNSNNFFVDLYIDPPFDPTVNYHQIISPTLGLPWSAQWFFVPPGESYVFTTTWVFTDVRTFDIWAQVDSDGNVTEAIEDNNTKKVSVSVLTSHYFRHDTHRDFLTNMASTLDNSRLRADSVISESNGILQLGRFTEPPFFERPFTNGACEITTDSTTISDYEMASPDTQINKKLIGSQAVPGKQVKPHIVAGGNGVVAAIWEDGRNGEVFNRDIYLRYSTDGGETWGDEIRVNDDAISNHVNQLNPVAALSDNGNLLVAWQDRRHGDYDIYVQQFLLSDSTLTKVGNNILAGGADSDTTGDQINPDIAVSEDGGFYLVWQDTRDNNYNLYVASYLPLTGTFNGPYIWTLVRQVHDDPSITQQSNPAINVIDWYRVVDIEYTIGPAPDYEVIVTDVISEPVRILVVTWEDYRRGNADIAMMFSEDNGETFGFDVNLNDDEEDADQLDPDVALTKDVIIATISVPLPDGTEAEVEVEVPVTGIHTVWQDYRNGTPDNPDPDIYYNASQLGVVQLGEQSEVTIGENEKINQNDILAWQIEPVIQREPAVVTIPCVGEATEDQWNIFIVWADGRNYDSANYDIYYTIRSTCDGFPEGLLPNHMLNDGVRLPNFDNSNPSYNDYDPDHPPPGYQVNPSVATDIQIDWPVIMGGYLYVAWEDDRAGDLQVQKDIYFARSNLTFANHYSNGFFYGAGSQISNILDSGSSDTIWHTVDWVAATDHATYITVQTRLGNTISEVLNSPWYPERFPFQPQPGDCNAFWSGAPLQGYNAPGQHIEDASKKFRPQARYIQYRVNMYARRHIDDRFYTPVLDSITIYYESEFIHIYLPLVLR